MRVELGSKSDHQEKKKVLRGVAGLSPSRRHTTNSVTRAIGVSQTARKRGVSTNPHLTAVVVCFEFLTKKNTDREWKIPNFMVFSAQPSDSSTIFPLFLSLSPFLEETQIRGH